MVTDYDCWHEEFSHVEVSQILAVLGANAQRARDLIAHLARALPPVRAPSSIDTCLDGALITAPAARDPAMIAALAAVAGRAIGGAKRRATK